MNLLKGKLPKEVLNIIQSYLVEDKVNKIETYKLICHKCGKEYFGNIEKNNDLCPCYITWLYFRVDFENPQLR